MKSVLLLLVIVCAAFAGVVSVSVEARPEQVTLRTENGFTVVELAAEQQGVVRTHTREPGRPLLPVLSGNVLIPAGAELTGIEVVAQERRELAASVRVHPAQPMRPLSRMYDVPFFAPDPASYSSDERFPATAIEAVPAGSKAGFRVAGFLYCPFEYYPASGRLVLVTRAAVRVSYQTNAVPVTTLSSSQAALFGRDVEQLVMNRRDLARFAPPVAAKDATKETDVVMFTSSTLAPALAGIRSWLARKGYYVEIVRHDTISLPGRDAQEKMRNLVKQKFADEGLKYVILAGDYQHCPVRYGYLPYSTYNVPADMYFGDLDGNWDANGNNNFGEMTGDNVDLLHDVYVGRLPFDDANHAANFLRKDTTYEICPDTTYLSSVLLPGEVLWANINYHGSIVNQNIARALNSDGTWVVDSGLNLGSSRVITGLNAGRHLFHFAGHGSRTAFGSTFSTSNLASLTNTAKPAIVNTMACDCGWFDDASDCLGEQFVNATNGGAVSTMFNARYGWGAPPCQGPNENMNSAFFASYLAGMTQGRAHGLARDFLRNESFSQMTARWAMYTNTLQGDPTMTMWRAKPAPLAVTHPDTIAAMPQVMAVEVERTDGPVSSARVAVTHLGELLGRALSGPDGIAYVPLAVVEDTWTLVVSVTAQDCRIYEATVRTSAGCAGPLPALARLRVDDANGRLDPFEESDLYVVIENRGTSPVESLSATLSSASGFITLPGDWSYYGTLAPGDTAVGGAYRVSVDRDCPNGHRAPFQIALAAGGDTWRANFELVIGVPHARGGLWATLDTGDYCLSVCGNGGIGTTQWRGEGYGLIYPKSRMWSAASMMHGSFLMGTDTNWVADNYYGNPNWQVTSQDFAMAESVRRMYPAPLGDMVYTTTFTDAQHAQPKDVRIEHRAYGSARPAHKDFIIVEYRIHNEGTTALENLHTAVMCDFRTIGWNANDSFDYAGTDSLRNLAFVRSANSSETLALGVRHIYPTGMSGFANCVNEWTHVYNGFTKAEKMKLMDGTLRSTTGTTRANWSGISSSGPYHIAPGDSQVVAFVICGSRTVAQLLPVSDTAANWYAPPTGQEERPEPALAKGTFEVFPRLFRDGLTVRYALGAARPLVLTAYDASGRVAAQLCHTPAAPAGSFTWRPELSPGVYFVRVDDYAAKVVRAE